MHRKAAKILNCLKNKKTKLIFLSPHLDDAIFSCGGIIEQLRPFNDVEIISIFTEGDKPPYTLSTRKYLKITGYKDLNSIYKIRREEDKRICKRLGIKCTHLGYKDSLVRKYNNSRIKNNIGRILPEVNHLYPIYNRILSRGIINSNPNSQDKKIITELKSKLKELNDKNIIFFAPLAIGDHVDHHIVRLAIEKSSLKIIYYCDIPYAYSSSLPKELISNLKLRKFILNIDKTKKEKISVMYSSQYKHVFSKTKLENKEVYYLNRNVYEFLKFCE